MAWIQIVGEKSGNFSGFFAKLRSGLFNQFFSMCLRLRLGLFLVPFGGLEHLFHGVMLQVDGFAFQFVEIRGGDGLRGLIENLLDTAEVFAKACKRIGKRFVSGIANAILLHGHGGIQQGTAAGEAMYSLFGLGDMRLHQGLNLGFEDSRA